VVVVASHSYVSSKIEEYTVSVVISGPASFEDCVWASTELTPNADLEQLGIAMLECMNGLPSESLRDLSNIRHQRELNKMFGLHNGETWSGYKLLVDFLDNTFNGAIPAIAKLEKPVSHDS
jgi:hypothetical protein